MCCGGGCSVQYWFKTNRPDYHYFAASLPFRSVRTVLTGFKVRGAEYRGCILQTRASQQRYRGKPLPFFNGRNERSCREKVRLAKGSHVTEESRGMYLKVSSRLVWPQGQLNAVRRCQCTPVSCCKSSSSVCSSSPLAGLPNHSQHSWSSSRRCSDESLICNCQFVSLLVHISSKIL